VELKTSKAGKLYASLALAVVTGKGDDGGDATTWIRTTVFGETAEEIAAAVVKGDRCYVEGSLTLNTWTAADCQQRTGLNCAAWRCKPLGLIGERKAKSSKPATSTKARKPAQAGNGAANNGASKGGAKHERPFNDPLPF
jgi:single-stranded DNA-binding protein